MSALIVGVLKLTCRVLVKKARSEIAKRVKHDEDYLSWILDELSDIKGKLAGLARKDLLSSISFLHEGINGLDQCLQQLKSIEEASEVSERKVISVEMAVSTGSPAVHSSPINKAIAYMKAISSSNIASSKRYKSAKDSFARALERATDAFSNTALSIEDRIQATQVRVTARILERLEDPSAAVSDCLLYLRELHEVGDIKDIFSVLVNGGLKNKLKIAKNKRLNNARLVHLMNQLLFEFAGEFASLSPKSYADWPVISFGEKSYHPVFGEYELVEKLEDSGVRVMSPYPHFKFRDKIFPPHAVVNSKGKIVAEMFQENTIKIFQNPDECHTFCEIPNEDNAMLCRIVEMDIDAEDSLHVLAGFHDKTSQQWSYKLFIFDEDGKKTQESLLPFLQNSSWIKLRMAVNKDGKIAILNCQERILHIGSPKLDSKSFKRIEVDSKLSRTGRGNMRLMDFDETKILSANRRHVRVYTEEGKLECKFKTPEEHGFIASVAISHTTKRILVETSILSDRLTILSYSERGKLTDSLCLCLDKLCLKRSKWIEYAKLSSHPNGAVALVGETGAALLQL